MRYIWTDRRLAGFSAVLVFAALSHPVFAQRGGAPASPGGAGSAGTNTPASPGNGNVGRGGIGNVPGSSIPGSIGSDNNGPYMNRPIFLSGKVMFDDGSQPNTNIR